MLDLKIVTVCLNYDDYLAITLPRNIAQHKDITVVTDAKDHKTQAVATKAGALCVISSRIHDKGANIAKGKAINDALDIIKPKEWVLLIDADIILPNGMIDKIKALNLDKNKLYCTKRILGPKKSETQPYGYFQLFNVKANALKGRNKIYEERHGTADMDDSNFGIVIYSTERRKRLCSPEFDVIHIPHGEYMQNWNGRVSPRIDQEEMSNAI